MEVRRERLRRNSEIREANKTRLSELAAGPPRKPMTFHRMEPKMSETTISYDGNNFGTVKREDYTVSLREQAEPTSRLLNDWERKHGYAEWSARGTTSDGREARVYWLHVDDGETLPEDYDWSDVDRVEIE